MPSLSTSLVALAAVSAVAADESILGIYVFHRHGDRTSKSWPPTQQTALGADQVYASGAYFRDRYVAANASTRITALSSDLAALSQIRITAPADTVLQNSANVFTQGLYPPAGSAAAQTLANGTTVEGPFGGYQYIPVNIVSSAASAAGSEDAGWLQGASGCANGIYSSNAYFSSAEYEATRALTADFYAGLLPVVNTTFTPDTATFKNAYTIFDYINVATIHNETIPSSDLLTDDTLRQLKTRADEHEWGLAYNASEPVRAIAGAVLAGQVLKALNTTVQAAPAKKNAARLQFQFGAYATFMAFFGLADLHSVSSDFQGLADYASSMVFELVTNASVADATAALDPADIGVRFRFSNGSAGLGSGLAEFPLFGQAETPLPWATFAERMGAFAIGDTADWCTACGNTTGVCSPGALGTASASSSGSGTGGSGISRPVAGVIGALVTLAVVLGVESLVMLLGGLRVVKKSVAAAGKAASSA